MRIAAICALLAMSLPAPAAGQSLAERAAALPAPEPRFIENIKVGIRSVTFAHMAISVSNPKTMYIGSYDGYVFATHDGGLSWSEGRLIVQRQGFYGLSAHDR